MYLDRLLHLLHFFLFCLGIAFVLALEAGSVRSERDYRRVMIKRIKIIVTPAAAYRFNFEIGLTRFAQAHLDLYVFSIHGDVNLHHT